MFAKHSVYCHRIVEDEASGGRNFTNTPDPPRAIIPQGHPLLNGVFQALLFCAVTVVYDILLYLYLHFAVMRHSRLSFGSGPDGGSVGTRDDSSGPRYGSDGPGDASGGPEHGSGGPGKPQGSQG